MNQHNSNIRVGIDIRKYFDYGIGTYLQNLIAGFQQIGGMELIYFASNEVSSSVHGNLQGSIIQNNSPKYSIQELLSLSSSAHNQNLDLYHAPHYTLPLMLNMPSVVTIHDIIHLRMKEYFSLPQRMYARWMIGHACRNSSAIIVVSEFTKQELICEYRVPERKIHVVYNGVHESFFTVCSDPEKSAFKRKYGITKPYFLYTGSVKPHKNVHVLLKAFARVLRDRSIQLVMTGEKSALNADLLRHIKDYRIHDSLIETGRITEEELRTAYQSAEAVVLPSFYEGFGLSMIEAMASGVPAIGARTSSITEIVGDAGLLFDPNDDDELARHLISVMDDRPMRDTLFLKGKERAAQFTWNECAVKTLKVYEEVLK